MIPQFILFSLSSFSPAWYLDSFGVRFGAKIVVWSYHRDPTVVFLKEEGFRT